jgi:hypothetical protein
MGWPDARFLGRLVKKHIYGEEVQKIDFLSEKEATTFRFWFLAGKTLEVFLEPNSLGVFLDGSEKGSHRWQRCLIGEGFLKKNPKIDVKRYDPLQIKTVKQQDLINAVKQCLETVRKEPILDVSFLKVSSNLEVLHLEYGVSRKFDQIGGFNWIFSPFSLIRVKYRFGKTRRNMPFPKLWEVSSNHEGTIYIPANSRAEIVSFLKLAVIDPESPRVSFRPVGEVGRLAIRNVRKDRIILDLPKVMKEWYYYKWLCELKEGS